MAQKIVRELVDDVDGSQADDTVTFSWKGYTYEIDLSSKNIGTSASSTKRLLRSLTRPAGSGRQERHEGAGNPYPQ